MSAAAVVWQAVFLALGLAVKISVKKYKILS